jgi:hypothetical protein
MKKLIFLLLMVVIAVGFVFAADAVHPPRVLSLDMELTGYSVQEAVVTPGTVLATQLFFELQAGFLALPDTIDLAGQPHGIYHLIEPINTGHGLVIAVEQSHWYWLRL